MKMVLGVFFLNLHKDHRILDIWLKSTEISAIKQRLKQALLHSDLATLSNRQDDWKQYKMVEVNYDKYIRTQIVFCDRKYFLMDKCLSSSCKKIGTNGRLTWWMDTHQIVLS